MSRAVVLALAGLLVGCTSDVDPPWQLDHDRIVAVRATPPRILTGERAELDALLALEGGDPAEQRPEAATVVSPASLMGIVGVDSGRWYVTAPPDAQLAAVRSELMLEPGAPVPVQVGVSYAGQTLLAVKTVWLGESAQNPVLDTASVNGVVDGSSPPIAVEPETDVPLSVDFSDEEDVNWLTSVGEMHDFDLPQAYLRVEPENEKREGHLAVVVRTRGGGVGWRVWPLRVDE